MSSKLVFLHALLALSFSVKAQSPSDDRSQETDIKPPTYGNNIVSISLLNITDAGMTMGFAYERFIDRKGMVSVYLPFAYYVKGWGGQGDIQTPESPFGEINRTVHITQFRPTVKIYPFTSKGKVRYAVGPQFSYEEGTISWSAYNRYLGSTDLGIKKIGILLNNSLMLQPHPHLYMGVELGIGFTFVNLKDNVVYTPAGSPIRTTGMTDEGRKALAHFSFNMGYRF